MSNDRIGTDGSARARIFPCTACGAQLEYAPGTSLLRCPYCGYQQPLVAPGQQVRQRPFDEWAHVGRRALTILGAHAFACLECGARMGSDAALPQCAICAAPLVADTAAVAQIAPDAVVPFAVDRDGVLAAMRRWVSSRWFAPSSLRKVRRAESLHGAYLPHWTFDARTVTMYTGQRGKHYWDTETYTEMVNGRSTTRTRQVRKTRWHSTRGTVGRDFSDVLVPACGQVPEKQLSRLGRWPVEHARPYQADYLAGYQALRYDVEPEAGLESAKARMAATIHHDCRRDIGGDAQRVQSVDTRYSGITFRLMLLPVWVAAYLHGGRTWQVLINGCTGEVVGRRPYSPTKIVTAAVAAIAVLVAVILLVVQYGHLR